jgi:hypothetical protein
MSAVPLKMPEESPWVTLLVSLAVVGMLALFYSVVTGAVEAGELRRQIHAAQNAAVSHCNALPTWNDTMACRKDLNAKVTAEEPSLLASR